MISAPLSPQRRPLSSPRARAALAVLFVVMLTSCRVDVTIDVDMAENGSGDLSVTVVADAAVLAAAPGLAEDVRTDDLAAAGWTSEGATLTPDGLSLTIVHPFDTPEQATALLSTLNGPSGPLQAISIQRVATISEITYSITGTGRLDGGLEAFTDPELLTAVGGMPYAEQIAASGSSPVDTVGVVLRLHVEGDIESTTGDVTGEVTDAGSSVADPAGPVTADGGEGSDDDSATRAIEWDLALDGSETQIEATSVKSLERGRSWQLLATLLLVLLIGWVAVSIAAMLVVARRRRRLRSSRRRVEQRLVDLPYQRVYHDDHTS